MCCAFWEYVATTKESLFAQMLFVRREVVLFVTIPETQIMYFAIGTAKKSGEV